METPYPFAEKERQYREYDLAMLNYALTDARETLERAEEMRRAGYAFHGRKGPGYRADDVHTLCKIIGEKYTADPNCHLR